MNDTRERLLKLNQEYRYDSILCDRERNCKDDLAIDVKGRLRWKYHHYVGLEENMAKEIAIPNLAFTSKKTQANLGLDRSAVLAVKTHTYSAEVIDFANTARKIGFQLDNFSVDLVLYLAEKQRWLNSIHGSKINALLLLRNIENFEWKIRNQRMKEIFKIEQNLNHSRFLDKLELNEELKSRTSLAREENNLKRCAAVKSKLELKKKRLKSNIKSQTRADCISNINRTSEEIKVEETPTSNNRMLGIPCRFPSFPFGLSFLDLPTVVDNPATCARAPESVPIISSPSSHDCIEVFIPSVETPEANLEILTAQAAIRSTLIKRRYECTLMKKKYLMSCLENKEIDMSKIYDSDEDNDDCPDFDNYFNSDKLLDDVLIKIKLEKTSIQHEKLLIALSAVATAERLRGEALLDAEKIVSEQNERKIREKLELEMKLYDEHSSTFVQQCLVSSSNFLINQMTEEANLKKINKLVDILSNHTHQAGILLKNEIIAYLNEQNLEQSISKENKAVELFLSSLNEVGLNDKQVFTEPVDMKKVLEKVEKDLIADDL
eukprot:NODE_975_length_2652_cov_0.575793.p1 type:complete len:549 gc:universal NODE_975_length_2652_cov_0.575793:1867-221(-)